MQFHCPFALKTLPLLVASLLAQSAMADTVPFVDNYKTNVTANTSTSNNAALALLQGYSQLWSTGSAWNTGAPTALGASVMAANEAYVVNATNNRTAAQAEAAYLTDRRNQSFSAIAGLGNLAAIYRSAAGATTTINSVAADAITAKYDDKGTGSGLTTSASVGSIVSLVNTLRGSYSSTTPAKTYFNSPRPFRLNDSGVVVSAGTETTGYYTSTLADGTPNKSTALTYFPSYASNVSVLPTLLAARSTTPATDGGFASGHTNALYLASFAMGYAMPTSFQSMLLNASEMGNDRIVAGMHLPLDVMGGRMLATALSAAILSDSANAGLKASALAQGTAFVAANTTPAARFADYSASTLAANAANKALYTFRMNYGLPDTGSTTLAASVPKGAEVLLETRQAYLTAEQRREVLRTTAIASGNALLDDAEGWGRLNLYAAADGFGRFDSTVTVNMNGSLGGYSAKDAWRNDVSGTGGLVKQGSGELGLTGNNSYAGGTVVEDGTLVAASEHALGTGNVVLNGGRLVDYAPGKLTIGADFTQVGGSVLELVIGQGDDGLSRGLLDIVGSASFAGTLHLTFLDGYSPLVGVSTLISAGALSGTFSSLEVEGLLSGYAANVSYSANGVTLNISAVPEPESLVMALVGLAACGFVAKRRRLAA